VRAQPFTCLDEITHAPILENLRASISRRAKSVVRDVLLRLNSPSFLMRDSQIRRLVKTAHNSAAIDQRMPPTATSSACKMVLVSFPSVPPYWWTWCRKLMAELEYATSNRG